MFSTPQVKSGVPHPDLLNHADSGSAETAPSHPLSSAMALCLMVLPLMLAGWVVSFAPFDDFQNRDGKPLIVDFVCFYVAGQCINEGAIDRLYDDPWADERSMQLFPSLSEGLMLPNRYPPLLAVLVSPLARLSYPLASLSFLLIESGCLLVTYLWWRRELPALREISRGTLLAACFGFPMALECLMGGQLSVFTFTLVSATLLLLRQNRQVAAGAVLCLTMYKPNVAVLLTMGLVLRYPRMMIGLILSGLGLLVANIAVAGVEPFLVYVELMKELALKPWQTAAPIWKVHGLQPYLEMIVGAQSRAASLLIGAVLVVTVVTQWRREKLSTGDSFSLLLLINSLFGMYVPIYDLLLLLPVLLLQAEEFRLREQSGESRTWPIANRLTLPVLSMLIVLGPHLSQEFMIQTRIQPFAPILLITVVWSVLVSRREFASESREPAPAMILKAT